MPKPIINIQSPYTAQDFRDFLADPVTRGTCWKLTPHPTSILTAAIAATSHTRDLVLPGHGSLVFRRAGGIVPTAVDTEAGQESAGLALKAIFHDDYITPEQLDEGDWDGAQLQILTINYANLDLGQMIEFEGPLGGFTEEGPVFQAEARPVTSIARFKVGRRASANCDVREFGDPIRCQRDLTDLTHTEIEVTTGNSQDTFRASALPAALVRTMLNGKVIFTSGLNTGRIRIVRTWNAGNGEITLQRALPHLVQVGDEFTAVEGCGRTKADCIAYDNVENFQGLSFITNIERFNQIIRSQ